jgi:NAD(P)-dependent dehydrogenase (short-subunit alcohol dehydrogenase family)
VKVDLKNKVALVTGAARNIGKAIADTLADNGARVVYADIDGELAAQAASARPGCSAAPLDVTNDALDRELIARIARDFGGLDILVNNAGTNTAHRVAIDEFSRSEWDRLLAVDLTSVYVLSQAAAQVMRRQGSGRIINIASVLGLVPARNQCAYVAPGSILTDGTRELFYGESEELKERGRRMLAHVPLGRPGTSQEIAHAVLFLAAPESGYINGHTLTVDGGWTAGYIRDF